ncbi:hypothetical protein [Vibrio sp. AND4]|uniref:hypothetical protein n=1 Tax=Vibrio sp. AND4 TaxID=314289 RepID=UPI00015EFC56|nr:hypothetical protein [Vibrio sp. AND4]EDP60123.1 hypothetical protein AND4_01903 [Vibrio sp. AND4]
MVKPRKVAIIIFLLMALSFCCLLLRSLGSYFSAHAHYGERNIEVIVTAKSGIYEAISLLDGIPYKTNSGIYFFIGNLIYFIGLDVNYREGLETEFAVKAINTDLAMHSTGVSLIKLDKENNKLSGILKGAKSKVDINDIIVKGRLSWW